MDAMPWDARPSILHHVREHIPARGPGLDSGGNTLPDDGRQVTTGGLTWGSGSLDGVFTHHARHETGEAGAEVVELVLRYCEEPTATNLAAAYRRVIETGALAVIDQVVPELMQRPLDRRRLVELAYTFASVGADREPVKFGMAILGACQPADDYSDLFLTLGRHEEFTLFAAVALVNSRDNAERKLFELARSVTGWGRIHVVERLAGTDDPEIKQWLLREGFRNDILYEYLAWTCATAGGLLAALSEDQIDRELLTAAGQIINSLILGGPAEDMDDYDDGALAVEMYLRHLEPAASTWSDLNTVRAINDFASADADDARVARGWSSTRRAGIRESCARICNMPYWRELVLSVTADVDHQDFHRASGAADMLGLDVWEPRLRWLAAEPLSAWRWCHVMNRCTDQQIDQFVSLAARTLDLQHIATGPALEAGFGGEFEPHGCLVMVLQELRRFPGHGLELIEAGLSSPVINNRGMATRCMAALPTRWPEPLRSRLEAAAAIEPHDGVRALMKKVLSGDPLDEDE
ncbi:MAG: hypothetical protein AB7K09_13130 [Planctomycetota bacterium]